jgi:hypothetical protein
MEGITSIIIYAALALNLLLVLAVARIYGEVVKIRKLLGKD